MKHYLKPLTQAFQGTTVGLNGIINALTRENPTPPDPPGPEPIPLHENTIFRYSDGTTQEYDVEGEFYDESYEKSGLTAIEFGTKVNYIGDAIFADCPDLESVVFQGDISFGHVSFNGCSNLLSVLFMGELNGSGESTFGGCPITSVVLPADPYDSRTIGGDGGIMFGELRELTLLGFNKSWCIDETPSWTAANQASYKLECVGISETHDCTIHCEDGDVICRQYRDEVEGRDYHIIIDPEVWAMIYYKATDVGEYWETGDTVTLYSLNNLVRSRHMEEGQQYMESYKIENGVVSIAIDENGITLNREEIAEAIAQGEDPYYEIFSIDSNKTVTIIGDRVTEAYLVQQS